MSDNNWQKMFDDAWHRCESLQKDTSEIAARSWYTKGRVSQSVSNAATIATLTAERDQLREENARNVEQLQGEYNHIDQLRAELAAAKAVIEKLPRTKDGVAIALSVDYVWLYHDKERRVVKWQTRTDDVLGAGGRCYPLISDEATGESDCCEFIVDERGSCITKQVATCYSTRELAEAALASGEGK